MPSYNVSEPVFPQLGQTVVQPSRVNPAGFSPFAAFLTPVPPPSIVDGAEDMFPDVEEVLVMREMKEAKEDESDLERRRQEAREFGQKQGYAEGFRKGTVEGYDLGREQGLKEAYETVLGENRELTEEYGRALQAAADRFNQQLGQWMREREEAMADLAMEAVRRLLSHELATTRESAISIAQDALGELTHATHARIRVNPFDHPVLEHHRSELISMAATLRDVEIVADHSIMGGCVVETEGGVVDSRLEVRIGALEEAWQSAA